MSNDMVDIENLENKWFYYLGRKNVCKYLLSSISENTSIEELESKLLRRYEIYSNHVDEAKQELLEEKTGHYSNNKYPNIINELRGMVRSGVPIEIISLLMKEFIESPDSDDLEWAEGIIEEREDGPSEFAWRTVSEAEPEEDDKVDVKVAGKVMDAIYRGIGSPGVNEPFAATWEIRGELVRNNVIKWRPQPDNKEINNGYR